MTIRAPAIQAQLIETFILLSVNHQSLIATKANRVVRAAQGRTVLEFGSRRAQGIDGAVSGARAAFIGGCKGTACTISDQMYGVPAGGTMAHAWVQMFDTEYDAFLTYCKLYPNSATLLIDTYNVLESGLPNAIKAFKEYVYGLYPPPPTPTPEPTPEPEPTPDPAEECQNSGGTWNGSECVYPTPEPEQPEDNQNTENGETTG